MQSGKIIDLLVVGGGINGTGIALDAAGRGLSVMLCEKNDLGSGTSSASTKLIHGGLRYLEHYHFKLVREALNEREVLLKKAPHLITPLRLIIPHDPSQRPQWLIRIGLWLYDHLGKRCSLPASKRLNLKKYPAFKNPLSPGLDTGFAFSDCWVDDARLVIANALGAAERGAIIRPYTEVTAMQAREGLWQVEVYNKHRGQSETVMARAIVNATGPWVKSFMFPQNIRLVRGSHIVVPKRYEGDHAYLIQHPDGRVIFVIPYEHEFTLIGTTEIDTKSSPDQVNISDEEIHYLISLFNEYFAQKLSKEDIVWHYSGVRPLIDQKISNSSALSRDYSFETKLVDGAPILTIHGGKITTYRTLSEAAVNQLCHYFPGDRHPWTAQTPLPGGDIAQASFHDFFEMLKTQYPWVRHPLLERWAKQYGTRIHTMIGSARTTADLGQYFGADCFEQELRYLIRHEWARTTEDLLFRRTKLGLHLIPSQIEQINHWLNETLSL